VLEQISGDKPLGSHPVVPLAEKIFRGRAYKAANAVRREDFSQALYFTHRQRAASKVLAVFVDI
jgi:hypothetical protein